eukprot:9501366-Pyramimonas_sp.AAC.2
MAMAMGYGLWAIQQSLGPPRRAERKGSEEGGKEIQDLRISFAAPHLLLSTRHIFAHVQPNQTISRERAWRPWVWAPLRKTLRSSSVSNVLRDPASRIFCFLVQSFNGGPYLGHIPLGRAGAKMRPACPRAVAK